MAGIGQRTRQGHRPVLRFTVSASEHRGAKIGRDDLPVAPQATGKGQGEVGGATAHIEQTRTGLYAAALDRLPTPAVVQAKAPKLSMVFSAS
jgi:hypothetical protein